MAKKNDTVSKSLTNDELAELEHLRKQVSDLEKVTKYQEAEIAYLKKLQALMQSKQEKLKKQK